MRSFIPHRQIAMAVVFLLASAWNVGLVAASAERTLHLERIETEPGSASLAAAIGDLTGLRAGDAINVETLRVARRVIGRSGWFDQVAVFTRPGTSPGALVLVVEGKLDRGLHLETGVGHDPLEGWYFNLIGARAQHFVLPATTARAMFQVGPRRSVTKFELEARRVGGSNFDLLLDASGGGTTWIAFDDDRLYEQTIDRSHLELGVRVHPTRSTALSLWIGGSAAESREIEQKEGERRTISGGLVGETDGTRTYADFRLDLTLDRRDRAQPWRRGLWALARLEVSEPDSGTTFARARVALRTALPLPAGHALALRADAAWADRGTPYHLRPIFGGQGTVRGFRDASLSGGLGTRAIAAAGLEWRAPLLPRSTNDARVHGVLFIDTGTFYDVDGERHDWSTSVGWGLRVRLPWIERLAIDAAIPLTPTATGDPLWIHGSLGFGF